MLEAVRDIALLVLLLHSPSVHGAEVVQDTTFTAKQTRTLSIASSGLLIFRRCTFQLGLTIDGIIPHGTHILIDDCTFNSGELLVKAQGSTLSNMTSSEALTHQPYARSLRILRNKFQSRQFTRVFITTDRKDSSFFMLELSHNRWTDCESGDLSKAVLVIIDFRFFSDSLIRFVNNTLKTPKSAGILFQGLDGIARTPIIFQQ